MSMKMERNKFSDIAVIGAGAAGLLCASVISSSESNIKVTVFEKNSSSKKLD